MIFVTLAFPGIVPVTVPGIILDPDSTLFDQPALGALRYIGLVPARFRVSHQIVYVWTENSGAATVSQFATQLLHNLVPIVSSTWFDRLDLAVDTTGSFYGESLITLAPNDILQIGINGGDNVGAVQDGFVFSLSLMATPAG